VNEVSRGRETSVEKRRSKKEKGSGGVDHRWGETLCTEEKACIGRERHVLQKKKKRGLKEN